MRTRALRLACWLVVLTAGCSGGNGAGTGDGADGRPDADRAGDAAPDGDAPPDGAPPEADDAAAGDGAGDPGVDGGTDDASDASVGPRVIEATNPVLAGDHPDPHVLRTTDAEGRPTYYLTATVHNGGDIPIFTSPDLVHWTELPGRAFDRASTPGNSMAINEAFFCSLWAPQIVELGPGSYLLSFSAQRFRTAQAPCPPYQEDGGVYLAWAPAPAGPFARTDHPWEPLPASAHFETCPIRTELPRSVDYVSDDCQGTWCHQIIRLDSDVWRDPADGRWWLAYSWYTNTPPRVDWERTNHGEHVEVVELDAADPFTVRCDAAVAQVFAANPHDAATLERLRSYCPRCGEMLSMTRGRYDEEMVRDGCSWGVAEGANLFRRGAWVYLLVSGSAWDSGYYHVFWAAARTVEELAHDNTGRLVGRYLVPSLGQAFGHGTAVLGPDGTTWYFVHHRLRHPACRDAGDCARDVWLSPIEFEDRGDGLGDVWIRPRFPAEEPVVRVVLP
ncbi:MAG: family 43 glycosylhydrolase [Myxococcales bacterium]|nr:family 43 glycosylhydrolase [Myxococcales bacterium]